MGEPQHAGNIGGRSLWWNWQAPSDGSVLLSTEGSAFDTLLASYTGDLVNLLTPVASNDDAFESAGFSKIRHAVRAGTLYRIAVDGYNGATGAVQLAYSFAPAKVYTVSLSHTDGGQTLPPSGEIEVESDTAIRLEASPDPAFEFVQWEGDIATSANPVSVPVATDMAVRAVFRPLPVADGFETGDLSKLDWVGSGALPWYVSSETAAQGSFAARSGKIGHGQSSSLSLTEDFRGGSASFDLRVSSESGWDYLEFYRDGTLVERWSGEVAWTSYTFSIPEGSHTLEWRYVKDPANSVGLDAAFIDNFTASLAVPSDGTVPTISVSPAFAGGVEILVKGQTNQLYVIEATEVFPARWRGIYTNEARQGELRYIDPESVTRPQRTYRAAGP
jgi:hypothetical protein